MRVVLVAVHTGRGPQAVPLANAFLQGYLAAGAEMPPDTVRADFYLEDDPRQCAGVILGLRPTAVAFSLYLWNRRFCREVAAELHSSAPGLTVFAGGPEATAAPERILDDGYDFLVCGEGERPLAAVCKALTCGGDISGIPGVALHTEAGFLLQPAVPITELDHIPSPWLNGILDARAYPGILWQLSRGCGFSCDFCFDSRDRHGVRRFSLERVESELRHFTACGVSQVFVLDSTFNQDRGRAKSILRLIRRLAPRIHFHFEVRSEFIDREMAELFAAVTCSLQIGLQSADPGVLRQVGRSLRPDDFVSRTMLLNDTGATFGFDLIYGLPGDSLAGFRASLDFALSLYPNHLDIFPLAILPGTSLATRSAELCLVCQPAPPYLLQSSPTFSAEDMEHAGELGRACDIFYTRGKAVAWFNGMLTALGGMPPSAFLEEFAAWFKSDTGSCDEKELSDEKIWQTQRRFLASCCRSTRRQRILPALLDLVDYHYHYAAALMSPVSPRQKTASSQDLLSSRLRLAPGTRLVRFHYEILDVLDTGAADPAVIARGLDPCGSWGIIYPAENGVCTESVHESYYRFLATLTGAEPAVCTAEKAGISRADAREFLLFACREGIIERS